VFNERPDRAAKFYIKAIFSFSAQLANDENNHLLTLIAKSMGLQPQIYKRVNYMISLEYREKKIVLEKILPFLSEYREWLYWKESKLNVALSIAEYFKNKRNLGKVEYIEIIELLFIDLAS